MHPVLRVIKYCRVVLLYLAFSQQVFAQDNLDQLEQALETANGIERVTALNQMAKALRDNSPRDSIPYAEEALELARDIADQQGEIEALNNLGNDYYFLGEFDTALEYYETCYQLAIESEDDLRTANAVNNMGVIYFVWGEYEQSLEYYGRALDIRKRIGDQQGLASAYNNLGTVYDAAERYEDALNYYYEALPLYESFKDEGHVASTRNNIGLALLNLGRFEESLTEAKIAGQIGEQINDQPGLARSYDLMGMIHDAKGLYSEAIAHHWRALAVRRKIGAQGDVTSSLLNLGSTHTRLGKYEAAAEFLDQALALSRELKLKEQELDIHEAMSLNFESMGNYEKALESHRLFKQLKDELFDAETGWQLAELRTRYDLERKDRQIEGLEKERKIQQVVRNAGLAGSVLLMILAVLLYNRYRLKERANREVLRANKALKLAQQEREASARNELAHVTRVAFLGELSTSLAHELRQPLTAILSNAQAARRLLASDTVEDDEIDEALQDIVEGADRSREIIQKLRDMLRREDEVRESLDINQVLQTMESFIETGARQFGVTVVMELGEKIPPVLGDAIQLQQVVLNLVHNAADAMRDNDEKQRTITITTSQPEAETVLVAVNDQGPPIDQATRDRMFDPFFTTRPDGMGMGLPICHTIIEAHDGTLWASRNPNRGLTVQFTIPALLD